MQSDVVLLGGEVQFGHDVHRHQFLQKLLGGIGDIDLVDLGHLSKKRGTLRQ